MGIGTFPEPHSASPGAPYILREKIPFGDLNQIVANEQTLWNAMLWTPIALDRIGDGSNPMTITDATTSEVAVPRSSFSSSVQLEAGDVVTVTLGPFKVTNADVTNTASVRYKFVEDVGGANTSRSNTWIVIAPSTTAEVYTIACRHVVITPGWFGGLMTVQSGAAGAITVSGCNSYYEYGFYSIVRPQ
jgi:hypothetical protein